MIQPPKDSKPSLCTPGEVRATSGRGRGLALEAELRLFSCGWPALLWELNRQGSTTHLRGKDGLFSR